MRGRGGVRRAALHALCAPRKRKGGRHADKQEQTQQQQQQHPKCTHHDTTAPPTPPHTHTSHTTHLDAERVARDAALAHQHAAVLHRLKRGAELRGLDAAAVMHRSPRTIRDDALAVAAAELMELHRITSVAVLGTQGPERDRLVGLLTIGDLMRAKVV